MHLRVIDGKVDFPLKIINAKIDQSDMKIFDIFRLFHLVNEGIACYSLEEYENAKQLLIANDIQYYSEDYRVDEVIKEKSNNITYLSKSEADDHLINDILPERLKLEYNQKASDNKISLLTEATQADLDSIQKEIDVKNKINNSEITSSNFSQLSESEQDAAKLVLFKEHSPTLVDVSKALSACEFALTGIVKILAKSIDRTRLTESELAFFDALVGTFNLNDMPIDDTTDWRYQYLHSQFEGTQINRQEYFNKKLSVIGTV